MKVSGQGSVTIQGGGEGPLTNLKIYGWADQQQYTGGNWVVTNQTEIDEYLSEKGEAAVLSVDISEDQTTITITALQENDGVSMVNSMWNFPSVYTKFNNVVFRVKCDSVVCSNPNLVPVVKVVVTGEVIDKDAEGYQEETLATIPITTDWQASAPLVMPDWAYWIAPYVTMNGDNSVPVGDTVTFEKLIVTCLDGFDEWEPGFGGRMTPYLEYPSNIHIAGSKGNINLTLRGNQMLYQSYSGESFGVSYTVDEGTVSFDGTINVDHGSRVFAQFSVKDMMAAGTTYYPKSFTDGVIAQLRIYHNGVVDPNYIEDSPYAFTGEESEVMFLIILENTAYSLGTIIKKVGYVALTTNSSMTSYEPYRIQTLSIPTLNGLPAIKNNFDPIFTDHNGETWYGDEIDFARRKYIKRLHYERLTKGVNYTWGFINMDESVWMLVAVMVTPSFLTTDTRGTGYHGNDVFNFFLCNTLSFGCSIFSSDSELGFNPRKGIGCEDCIRMTSYYENDAYRYVFSLLNASTIMTHILPYFSEEDQAILTDYMAGDFHGGFMGLFKNTAYAIDAWLQDQPIHVLYRLKDPIEYDLDPTVVEAFQQLVVKDGMTIINDENLCMEVTYGNSEDLLSRDWIDPDTEVGKHYKLVAGYAPKHMVPASSRETQLLFKIWNPEYELPFEVTEQSSPIERYLWDILNNTTTMLTYSPQTDSEKYLAAILGASVGVLPVVDCERNRWMWQWYFEHLATNQLPLPTAQSGGETIEDTVDETESIEAEESTDVTP